MKYPTREGTFTSDARDDRGFAALRVGTRLAYHRLTMTNAAAWFAAQSFHQSRDARAETPPRPYVDTRPRVAYARPDGRVVSLIVDHGDMPDATVTCAIGETDPLWNTATRRRGTTSRFITLRLVAE